jgi:hypothetical protein
VLPIFTAAEGGAQLTSETADGTIQLLLARPISRSRIFATKQVTAAYQPVGMPPLLLMNIHADPYSANARNTLIGRVKVIRTGPWKGQRVADMDHDPVVADIQIKR